MPSPAEVMARAWETLVEPAVDGKDYEHIPPELRPVADPSFFEEEEPTKPYGGEGDDGR